MPYKPEILAEDVSMHQNIMRVTRSHDGNWRVQAGCGRANLHEFRVKSHAVAYARAMSRSSRSTLFVDDDCGSPVRQSSASLTYPIRLE